MEDKFEILDSVKTEIILDFNDCLFKTSQLHLALLNIFLIGGGLDELDKQLKSINSRVLPSVKNTADWMIKGVDCQILKPGENWQKGKFRMKISLEFCSDEPEIEETPEIKEPESPLDDLRRKINEATS
ncbi:KGK domain protein [Anabaena sphaerica FACHB-251]|uniref:KGK domain protein n=1 Tax=Anabaena sphaerica FACHB-251 TaxID=2692883 RepID=A0A926WGE0_9NOST|nr:KGK domain-containing protein [Anabaena sphaerica]MBD2292633.1 KGK domain protein [Anabaena sphaerica FACHB-251]